MIFLPFNATSVVALPAFNIQLSLEIKNKWELTGLIVESDNIEAYGEACVSRASLSLSKKLIFYVCVRDNIDCLVLCFILFALSY